MNLSQLKKSHYNVSSFFKAQDLFLVLCFSGLELYEDLVRVFYANLHLSQDSDELETLVLRTRIIPNDLLFEIFFDTKFSGSIPFTNGIWPDNFKFIFEETKKVVSDLDINLSNFGPLSFCQI